MTDQTQRPAPQIASSSAATAKEWLWTATAIGGMLAVYFLAPLGQHDDPLPLPVATAVSVVMALVLGLVIWRRVIRALEGNTSEGLPGLVILLALVVVLFSGTYFMLARSDPGQVAGLHTRLDSLYFTLCTLGTVGYGDIHPSGQTARAIASMQFVFNAIFVTALVRVILHQAQAKRGMRPR